MSTFAAIGAVRTVVRRATTTTAVALTSGIVSASMFLYYTNADRRLALGREMHFWRTFGPVIFDYWWNASISSPKVLLMTSFAFDADGNARGVPIGGRGIGGVAGAVLSSEE
ncbi:hypothetical protein ACHAXA_000159 [Cyclostephanos tholiformis]|uniref:Uncharacterized protein n=1 Tax=Cyclostephanos tholiformis TaxID=382380 RepID=A0ABD3SCD2_9STRA